MRPTATCAPTRHTGEWGAAQKRAPRKRGDGSAPENAPGAWALQGEEPASWAAAAPLQPSPAAPPRPRAPPPAAAAGCSHTRSSQPLRAHTAARTRCHSMRTSPRGRPRTVLAAPAVQQPLQLHRSAPCLRVRGRAQDDAACNDNANPLAIPLVNVEPAARGVALDLLRGRQERPCAPINPHTHTSMHTRPPPPPATRQRALAQASHPAPAASP
jgi:hypothetical protein